MSATDNNARNFWIILGPIALTAVLGIGAWMYIHMDSRVTDLEKALNQIDKVVGILDSQMRTALAGTLQRALDAGEILHRPEEKYAERDALIEKWRKGRDAEGGLTEADRAKFARILRDVLQDNTQPDGARSLAAEILRTLEQQQRNVKGEPPSTRSKGE